MANRWLTQFLYTFHKKAAVVDCQFTVAQAASGTGVSGLKGGGIAQVYMNTSTTPSGGNPNPASGLILVKFADNWNNFYMNSYSIQSPLSGTSITVSTGSALTVGAAYVITGLGTTTTAQWVVLGVPLNTAPVVGLSFIAAVTAGTGTGTVQAATTSGNATIEVVGSPALSLISRYPASMGTAAVGRPGPYAIFQCISIGSAAFTGNTNTSTSITAVSSFNGLRVGQFISGTGIPLGTTIAALTPGSSTLTLSAAATASATGVALDATPAPLVQNPLDGSVIYMNFSLSNSVIQVQGD